MSKNNDVFVDYKQLKTCVSIIMVLDHYGWVRQLKRHRQHGALLLPHP